MAVVINEMESTVDSPTPAPSAPAAPALGEISEDDFRAKFGNHVRELVREELDRYLRSAAD